MVTAGSIKVGDKFRHSNGSVMTRTMINNQNTIEVDYLICIGAIDEAGNVWVINKFGYVHSLNYKKEFKVVSISQNTNSFGLYGMVLLAEDGEAWEVAANSINVKNKEDILKVDLVQGEPQWHNFNFEIPSKLGIAPPEVISAVWGNPAEDE